MHVHAHAHTHTHARTHTHTTHTHTHPRAQGSPRRPGWDWECDEHSLFCGLCVFVRVCSVRVHVCVCMCACVRDTHVPKYLRKYTYACLIGPPMTALEQECQPTETMLW